MNKYFISIIKTCFKASLVLLLFFQTTACGQRGALTLPKEKAEQLEKVKPQNTEIETTKKQ